MIRYVPVILVVVLSIYTLIDVLQVGSDEVRNAPKWAWFVLILLFPVVGAVAYLVAGRPLPIRAGQAGRRPPAPRRSPVAPDDDAAFLASIRDLNSSQEKVLNEWEADLRRRERELREREQGHTGDDAPDSR